jgi:uncharacterized membrane protein YgcG
LDQVDHGRESRAVLAVAVALIAATAVPAHTGRVVDASDLVPAVVEQRVDTALAPYSDSAAVLVLDTTGGVDATEYAAAVAFVWHVPDVLVIAVRDGQAGVVGLPPAPVLDVVLPRLRAGAISDAVELGATELRRELGAVDRPPLSTVPAPAPVERHHSFPLGVLLAAAAITAAILARGVTRRRRLAWAQVRPVRWGSGWGRHVGGLDPLFEPRYRRVRDAVHAAEATTGLPLAFWLGPVADVDGVFATAELEGHAAMLAMVMPDGSAVEVRVADWAADRVSAAIADGAFGADPIDGFVTLAERVGTTGTPSLRASRSRRRGPAGDPTEPR